VSTSASGFTNLILSSTVSITDTGGSSPVCRTSPRFREALFRYFHDPLCPSNGALCLSRGIFCEIDADSLNYPGGAILVKHPDSVV